MIKRYVYAQVQEDLDSKIVIISGPRQSGKTTFSKSLFSESDYLNYDSVKDRERIINTEWNRQSEIVILDELHKLHKWKQFLKGVFDTEGVRPRLLVTGSAKMDAFRKVGDSLAGRFFKHRLYPFDIKELTNQGYTDPHTLAKTLIDVSGFPEPFLKNSIPFYKRWKKSYLDVILKQDLQDLATVRHISDIEMLIELLRSRIGSPISYSSLARDLQVSPPTVLSWLTLLENLYIIFKVTPYSKNINRSIRKEPKYYFYDSAYLKAEEGIKYENLVANALLKELHYLEDTQGVEASLHYIKNKNGAELDFLICIDNTVTQLIEVKLSDDAPSKNFAIFHKQLPQSRQLQLVFQLKREYSTPTGIEIKDAPVWLSTMSLAKKS